MVTRKIAVAGMIGRRLSEVNPPTQAPTASRLSPGNMEMVRVTIGAVNNSAAIVFGIPAMTCLITYNGSQQYVPWIGLVPNVGQAMMLLQPPLAYIIGVPSTMQGTVLTSAWSNFVPPGWTTVVQPQFRTVGDEIQLRGNIAIAGAAPQLITTTGNPPKQNATFTCAPGNTVVVASSGAITMTGGSASLGMALDQIRWSET